MQRIKILFSAQDMTEGKPMNNLLKFSIPLLIGNFAQQLYSTVDSIVVGHYVGDQALSAIGTTSPIINLLLVLFMAISTGSGIMVAQYFGARDQQKLSHSVGTSILLVTISSLLIMVIGLPLVDTLLRVTNTPVQTFDMAASYLSIILIGILGSGFYNIISGILRGLGDSFYPLLILLFAAVVNTVLDVWFVAGLHWGVAGTAWATIIAQGLSAVLCLMRLCSMKDKVNLSLKMLRPNLKLTRQLLNLGLPAGITQALFSLSMVFVQSLTNSMGYQIVTCSTAVMRIDGFAMLPNFTFGMAISTFIGQNIGANRMDRVVQGTKEILKLSLFTSVLLVLGLLFFSNALIRLFTTTEEIITLSVRAIRILAVGYIAMAVSQVFGGIMRGAGDTMPSMWISLFTTVIVRVPLAYLLASLTRSATYPVGSPDVLFVSLLTSWVLSAVITYIWYRRGKWKEKSLIRNSAEITAS